MSLWLLMMVVTVTMMMRMKVMVVVWGPMGSVAASCGADVAGPVLLSACAIVELAGTTGQVEGSG